VVFKCPSSLCHRYINYSIQIKGIMKHNFCEVFIFIVLLTPDPIFGYYGSVQK
jgi:hypothetical protein